MHAAKDLPFFFNAVTDDPTAAVRTLRREGVDRTFKAVEDMLPAARDHFERLVVIVPAYFALSHGMFLRLLIGEDEIPAFFAREFEMLLEPVDDITSSRVRKLSFPFFTSFGGSSANCRSVYL